MTRAAPPAPATLQTSFSFYVPASNPVLVQSALATAGAVVIAGPKGPSVARKHLALERHACVIFDYAGYEDRNPPVDPIEWMEAQASGGADRQLTPGRWVPWIDDDTVLREAVEQEWKVGLHANGSTLLLAVDYRWIGKKPEVVADLLRSVDQPVALVLGHRSDPLSVSGVLDGLLALTRSVSDISLLRSDHGAIGAVAFNAVHGSIGLSATYRHLVPQQASARRKRDDNSPRVFVPDLMDWYTALTVAGWGAASVHPTCDSACCGGRRIERFWDTRLRAEAEHHNRTVLAELASYIVNAPVNERSRLFARLCAEAVDRYGPMGKLSDVTEPRAQLVHWAQWA